MKKTKMCLFLVEDGIAEGLQNWFKLFTYLYVDLIEPRTKPDTKPSINHEEFQQIEASLREQRLHTIYTVSFYIDSFFSIASAIIELQKLTRHLRVRISALFVVMHKFFFYSIPESVSTR